MAYEPELQRLYAKYQPAGFQIVSVHAEQGHEQGIEYLKKHPKAWESLIDDDGELADSFRVPSYPSLYLFDANGKLVVALPHRWCLIGLLPRFSIVLDVDPRTIKFAKALVFECIDSQYY